MLYESVSIKVIWYPDLLLRSSAVTPPTALALFKTIQSPSSAPWSVSVIITVVLPLCVAIGLIKTCVVIAPISCVAAVVPFVPRVQPVRVLVLMPV